MKLERGRDKLFNCSSSTCERPVRTEDDEEQQSEVRNTSVETYRSRISEWTF